MNNKVFSILLFFNRQDDVVYSDICLSSYGLTKRVDYITMLYKESVESEVEKAKGANQLLIIGKISGSERATAFFVNELKRINHNLRVVFFDTEGFSRKPYDHFALKGSYGPDFCRELIPILARFLGKRILVSQ